jgi:hypothetical protein
VRRKRARLFLHGALATADKDKEIRVRTGKSQFQPLLAGDTATGMFSKGCVKQKDLNWLPKTNTDPNTRMENFGGVVFSKVLTKPGFRRCVCFGRESRLARIALPNGPPTATQRKVRKFNVRETALNY